MAGCTANGSLPVISGIPRSTSRAFSTRLIRCLPVAIFTSNETRPSPPSCVGLPPSGGIALGFFCSWFLSASRNRLLAGPSGISAHVFHSTALRRAKSSDTDDPADPEGWRNKAMRSSSFARFHRGAAPLAVGAGDGATPESSGCGATTSGAWFSRGAASASAFLASLGISGCVGAAVVGVSTRPVCPPRTLLAVDTVELGNSRVNGNRLAIGASRRIALIGFPCSRAANH